MRVFKLLMLPLAALLLITLIPISSDDGPASAAELLTASAAWNTVSDFQVGQPNAQQYSLEYDYTVNAANIGDCAERADLKMRGASTWRQSALGV
jgi:hypothetical protein